MRSGSLQRRKFIGSCAAMAASAGLGSAVGSSLIDSVISKSSNSIPTNAKAPFSFSVMLWTVERKLPFEQRIHKVADAGYHAVELVDEYKDWTKADYARARQQFHSLNMKVDACSGIGSSLCDPAQRDALLAEIRAKLPVLEELECSRLILLTGDRVKGLSDEQMSANVAEALKRGADVAASQNVELLLENIDPEENPNYFLTSVARGYQIIRDIGNPRVKFLYDFFHEQIAEGNLIAKIEKNLSLTALFHIADVPGRHEPGTGEINFGNIFRTLGKLNYSDYVAMEFMPVGDTVTALRTAREFAEKCGAEGRAMAATASIQVAQNA